MEVGISVTELKHDMAHSSLIVLNFIIDQNCNAKFNAQTKQWEKREEEKNKIYIYL